MFKKIVLSVLIVGPVAAIVTGYFAEAALPSGAVAAVLDARAVPSPQPPPGWTCDAEAGTCTRAAVPVEVAAAQAGAAEALDTIADLLGEEDGELGDELPATSLDFSDEPLVIVAVGER